MDIPRLPHNPEAERAFLGGIILGADGPWLDASDFFLPYHQSIQRALTRLKGEGKPIDVVTINDLLTPSELEGCGGIAYIAGLLDGLPKVANWGYYAEIIRRKAEQRSAITITDRYRNVLLTANGNAGELIDKCIADLTASRLKDSAGGSTSFSELFDSYDELLNAPKLTFAIRDFLQNDGITLIGGPAGHGKTLVMLSMVKALLTGNALWNHFQVEERAVRVVYLIPECARGPFAHRLKLFKLLGFAAPDDGRLLVRTLSKGPAPHLDDPRILFAVKGAHVFLDTAIRFTGAHDENSAAENQLLAKDLFALLASGARSVTGAHHSPKAFAKDNTMTLENVLRGSGDIGAILATCFGLKQIDKDQNIIHIENVKPRDFTPPLPFQLIGRPSLDDTGDLAMLKKPGECGQLEEEQPSANESKHREKNDRIAFVASWLKGDPDMPAIRIAEKFKEIGIDVDRSTASRYRAAARGRA